MQYVLTIKERKPDGSQYVFSESDDLELLESRAKLNNKQGLWNREFIVQRRRGKWIQ